MKHPILQRTKIVDDSLILLRTASSGFCDSGKGTSPTVPYNEERERKNLNLEINRPATTYVKHIVGIH